MLHSSVEFALGRQGRGINQDSGTSSERPRMSPKKRTTTKSPVRHARPSRRSAVAPGGIRSAEEALADPFVAEAMRRGIMRLEGDAKTIVYSLRSEQRYRWTDPEEWVRAATVAWLILDRDYPTSRIKLEVRVPRRTPNDFADIVVFRDDPCLDPYLVVESKAADQSERARNQWIEQLFGNATSLNANLALYDESTTSILFRRDGFPPLERTANRLGLRIHLTKQYGDQPAFALIAGSDNDIAPQPTSVVESRTRRAHSAIWSGGKRDPLTSFHEWSKMLFAKVIDERTTPNGERREFQVGANETVASVANRIHALFAKGCRTDPSIFPPDIRIQLPDTKIAEVVRILEDLAFTRTDVDSIGKAFEQFFSSIFRGGLGQYFTMRQLSRFTVAMLEVGPNDYAVDPTAGSGGFLLEILLQCWHRIDHDFAGRAEGEVLRLKQDFALSHVYGIELHDVVGRICKINLLLHHDGHTNIEANRSCLDSTFTKDRLNPPMAKFTVLVGNPPFGTDIKEGETDQLGENSLANFKIAEGRQKIDSEQVILERSIDLLEPAGRLGLVLPDGLLNNQGEISNCPATRRLLARSGLIEAIVSLPDYAFRKSGAQNKTSILFFRKFTEGQRGAFERALANATEPGKPEAEAIVEAILAAGLNYKVFLAEANHVGYTPAGQPSPENDLYRSSDAAPLLPDQEGSVLGEWRRFKEDEQGYSGRTSPDCMCVDFDELWRSHSSNRLDPKFHLFEREEQRETPEGWITLPLGGSGGVMRRRSEVLSKVSANDVAAETSGEDATRATAVRERGAAYSPNTTDPDAEFKVMTISQTGEIRERPAGKGNNPPRWMGTYFIDSPGSWYVAKASDVVYSGIDLWKGCISVVPPEFDGALVSKEFPIYEVIDDRLLPEFLQCLLRTRYYQRAFRAITTGHSNRRRTQEQDFESLRVSFPASPEAQRQLIAEIQEARSQAKDAAALLKRRMLALSNIIDGRGEEDLPEISEDEASNGDAGESVEG